MATDDINPADWPLPHCPLAAVLAFVAPLRLDPRRRRRCSGGDRQRDRNAATRSRSRSGRSAGHSSACTQGWVHRMRGDLSAAREAARGGRSHRRAARVLRLAGDGADPSRCRKRRGGAIGGFVRRDGRRDRGMAGGWREGGAAEPHRRTGFGYLASRRAHERAAACLRDAEECSTGAQGLAERRGESPPRRAGRATTGTDDLEQVDRELSTWRCAPPWRSALTSSSSAAVPPTSTVRRRRPRRRPAAEHWTRSSTFGDRADLFAG